MKAAKLLTISATLWAASPLCAQSPEDALIEPVADNSLAATIPPAESSDLPLPGNPPPLSDLPAPGAAPAAPAPPAPAAAAPFGPLEQQKEEMQKADEGFIIKDAGLNDIFQYLAKSAGRQYFHNSKIAGPDYLVTGHLNDGNPLQQMEELAFMYGLSLHIKGNTIYALTQAQLAQLPSAEFHYQLRYLRPTDMEQIKELIKPMLSPGTGIVNFEPKTNTIIIIDSATRIEQARELLHGIDQAKGQIIVETKILRVKSGAAERVGVDWSSSLGEDGTGMSLTASLNSIFGIDTAVVTNSVNNVTGTGVYSGSAGNSRTFTSDNTESPNLVLSPVQLTAVLRALAEGGIANQVSNPTLITEDNEQATISIIDRVPIITSTTTPGSAGSEPIITEEVRYKIDVGDKTIDMDPEKHREIGISLVVTPTLLPDGTVRMKMRPRSAQITGEVIGVGINGRPGNRYPRVTESMVETLARVPDGHSLVVGGFYGQKDDKNDNKVPLLGDVPVLNFFFKSKESIKEQASLVFIVTPKSYNPTSVSATRSAHDQIRSATALGCDHDWIDPENPGQAHEPNLRRTVRGLQPTQAPYYPRAGETTGASQPAHSQPRFAKGSRR
jgi:type II secretory pathway component GspD/PulD (secretin)